MRHPKLLLSGIIVFTGIFAGIFFQSDLFACYLFTLTGLAIFIPVTLVAGILALAFASSGGRKGKWFRNIFLSSFSIIISLSAAVGTGDFINRWKVSATESYVAKAVPILDLMEKREGYYPLKLPVNILGPPPELLREYGDYTSDGSSFYFEYVNEPAGWAGGEGALKFDSTTRKWEVDR